MCIDPGGGGLQGIFGKIFPWGNFGGQSSSGSGPTPPAPPSGGIQSPVMGVADIMARRRPSSTAVPTLGGQYNMTGSSPNVTLLGKG